MKSGNDSSPQGRFLALFGKLFPAEEWPAIRLEPLLATLHIRELAAGTTILREGQACASVPFVLEGVIRIFKVADSGREISLYRIEEGQSCILSLGCTAGLPAFPATVVAETATVAAFMPNATIQKFFAEGASFRNFVLSQYSQRMTEVIELVEEIAFRKVDQRLAQWLAELGSAAAGRGRPGEAAPSTVVATHQELADHVGTSREVVSRILKDWEQRGALEISRGALRLLPAFEKLRL